MKIEKFRNEFFIRNGEQKFFTKLFHFSLFTFHYLIGANRA